MIKKGEFDYVNEQAIKFEEEIKKRAHDKRVLNVNHVESLRELQKEVPRTFAKTGIAIIKS